MTIISHNFVNNKTNKQTNMSGKLHHFNHDESEAQHPLRNALMNKHQFFLHVLCALSTRTYRKPIYSHVYASIVLSINIILQQAEEKEAKDWEREEPSVIARSFAIISRVSPSRPFAVWLVVGVWSVSQDWSTRRHVECWRCSWRMSFAILLLTPNTLVVRLWLPWMWCTLWRDRARLCTVSAVKQLLCVNDFKVHCIWWKAFPCESTSLLLRSWLSFTFCLV